MLVLIAVLLVLFPATVIAYPFLRRGDAEELPEDEASPNAELSRRWDAAVAGLRNTELERSIGNLSERDYALLRDQYMTEAALVLKAMEIEEQQEQELMEDFEGDVGRAGVDSRSSGNDE